MAKRLHELWIYFNPPTPTAHDQSSGFPSCVADLLGKFGAARSQQHIPEHPNARNNTYCGYDRNSETVCKRAPVVLFSMVANARISMTQKGNRINANISTHRYR